jgi:hypothetical protein
MVYPWHLIILSLRRPTARCAQVWGGRVPVNKQKARFPLDFVAGGLSFQKSSSYEIGDGVPIC